MDSSDIDNLPAFTDAQLVKLYRWGMANGAAGQSRTINGREITFPSMPDMITAIQWAEERINLVNGGDGSAVVIFGDPSDRSRDRGCF
jgi:hypothetical protein